MAEEPTAADELVTKAQILRDEAEILEDEAEEAAEIVKAQKAPTLGANVAGLYLHRALAAVNPIVPTRAARPVLQNILIVAREGGVDICGTDMEIGIRETIEECQVDDYGSALLPGKRLLAMAKELKGGTVDIFSADFQTTLKAAGCRFKLVGEDPADFPAVPPMPTKPDATQTVKVDVGTLQGMLNVTAYATAAEETRYAIQGIMLEVQGKKVWMVATDGKRLAITLDGWEGTKGPRKQVTALIPPRGLKVLLAGQPDDLECVLVFEGRRVLAQVGSRTVVMSKIEGTFPTYEEVIPKSLTHEVTLDVASLASAVRRASLVAQDGSNAVEFTFRPKGLEVSARAANVGETTHELPVGEWLAGQPEGTETIVFNPKYLLDTLKACGDEEIRFGWNGPRSAALLSWGQAQCVIMPVTLEANDF